MHGLLEILKFACAALIVLWALYAGFVSKNARFLNWPMYSSGGDVQLHDLVDGAGLPVSTSIYAFLDPGDLTFDPSKLAPAITLLEQQIGSTVEGKVLVHSRFGTYRTTIADVKLNPKEWVNDI